MNLIPEKVLLLGAGGPLGQALAKGLSQEGARVVATGRSLDPGSLDVSHWKETSERILGLSPATLLYLVNDKSLDEYGASAGKAAGNLRNILTAATQARVRRFVFASTAAIYGDQGEIPFKENDPRSGTSRYALLKIALESIIEDHAEKTGMATTTLRIFNVFGPGFSSSLINKLADPSVIPDLGISENFVRDYVHSNDVVAAVVGLLKSYEVGYTVFNVGSGRAISNTRLARIFEYASFFKSDYNGHSWSVADITLAQERLNFIPKISLEEFVNHGASKAPASEHPPRT
jgi:UDP-glucose 4-epimerase